MASQKTLKLLVTLTMLLTPVLGQYASFQNKKYTARIQTGWSLYKTDVIMVGVAIGVLFSILAVIHCVDCCSRQFDGRNVQVIADLIMRNRAKVTTGNPV